MRMSSFASHILLLDASPFPAALLDGDNRVLRANGLAERALAGLGSPLAGRRLDVMGDPPSTGDGAPAARFIINGPDGSPVQFEAHDARLAGEATGEGGSAMRLVYFLDVTGRAGWEEGLRFLAEEASALSGRQLFRSLASGLARITGARIVLFAERPESMPGHGRFLAYQLSGSFQPERVYAMEGTPCETVSPSGFCHIREGAAAAFPADLFLTEQGVQSYLGAPLIDSAGRMIGHVAVMDVRRLPDEQLAISLVRAFAARGAAELERMRATGQTRLLLQEKDVLIAELRHRVMNALQVVNSLLGLQVLRSGQPAERDCLRLAQERVRIVALAHETLLDSQERGEMDMSLFFQRLSSGLRITLAPDHPESVLEFDVGPSPLDLKLAVNCGLLLGELLSNAFRHVLASGVAGSAPCEGPRVQVRARLVGDELELSVADDGPGLPQGFENDGGGLGLTLARMLAARMGGKLFVLRPHDPRQTRLWPQDAPGLRARVGVRLPAR